MSWDLEEQLVEAVTVTEPSVVSIIASREIDFFQRSPQLRQVWGWSWVVINDEWYILTNRHVVDSDELTYQAIFADWTVAEITNVWQDPIVDRAVVKVADWTPLPQSALFSPRNRTIPLGQFTYAIGNALAEYQNSVTLWIISGKDRKIQTMSQDLYVWLYQTDTSISMGNSWWPLYTLDGNVIGINTAVSAVWENIWFAIPVSEELVQATLDTIEQNWSIIRPFVWIRYIDIDPLLAAERALPVTQWVAVEAVVPDSWADQWWVQAWDLITAINGLPISADTPFLYQLFSYVPGDTITLTYLRDWFERSSEIVVWRQ